jgi:hypothetical protein
MSDYHIMTLLALRVVMLMLGLLDHQFIMKWMKLIVHFLAAACSSDQSTYLLPYRMRDFFSRLDILGQKLDLGQICENIQPDGFLYKPHLRELKQSLPVWLNNYFQSQVG